MPSSATLATLRDRVEQVLLDSTNVVWATTAVDEALRQALEEYSKVRPLEVIGTVTPASGSREVALSGLTGLVKVLRVWWPYTSTSPEWPPAWVDWQVYDNAGTLALWLNSSTTGDGTKVARVWYGKLHTLNGLDGASSTTFSAADDGLLVLGAAGYCCLMRATDVVETMPTIGKGSDSYETMAYRWLREFGRRLRVGTGRSL